MIRKTVDANEACSLTSYIYTDIAGIYPITPSSPMAEHIDEWSNDGMLNAFNDRVKVIEMQSEAGAAGLVHGALQAGVLATTYTASQGLLLMIPNMYKIAGEMLPLVMHVAARSLSTHALSIMGDHQDIYAASKTGFAMLASSSVEDAGLLASVAHLASIKSSLPFMHFFDGFRTSHELQKINLLTKDELVSLMDMDAVKKFRDRALNPLRPITKGTSQNDDVYFQATEVRNKFYNELPKTIVEYMDKVNLIAKTNYQPFNYYGSSSADKVMVAMGSICETAKETIDYLNLNGYNVGLVEVHLYRPFAKEYLLKVLPKTVKYMAVLDRTKEHGSQGEPLYLDVSNALSELDIKIVGGRYGLSSKNTTPSQIKAIFDNLGDNALNSFTVGITDDVTNLSLKADSKFKISTSDEFLIYGYGSDGMISAAKSIIELIGDNTGKYVQGYFQYDSKKSGGVTTSHLRFNDSPIRSTYYVDSPKLVVCTKDTYLDDFDLISNIKDNGIFILNTNRSKESILEFMSDNLKEILLERHVKFYIIDAYKLASEFGIKNKISTIFESVIISLSKLMDFETAKTKLKEITYEKFYKKGEEILNANYKAIDLGINYLEEVVIPSKTYVVINDVKKSDVVSTMNRKDGDSLKTSAFLDMADGSLISGTSVLEKRGISDNVPSFDVNNCIQCNLCSFVCPHAVIRPFLLDQEEYDNAPQAIKDKCTKPLEPSLQAYYYTIGVSILDCTGCGLCIKTCPGKKGVKALEFKPLIDELVNNQNSSSEYLFTKVKAKPIDVMTVKTSQFKEPKFAFSGACAGCGETAYIKLLTQLFGDRMIIANATGCSSIYGASSPSTPYTVPWASSLFEDNAEYGYGILAGNNLMRNRIKNVMLNNMDNANNELFTKWLNNSEDYKLTKEVYDSLDYSKLPNELLVLKDYIPASTVWTIGGDGWAYDIGFGGIDHVLASNENINILVLDSQVYSNTGGQASKSTPMGSIAAFASDGKKTNNKDLAKMLMAYPNVYVAQVNLGANPNQLLKAFNEASNHNGPSIVIAYTPCIAHGIKGGLENSLDHEKLATKSGFFPLFRYKPDEEKFYLDSKDVDFNLYAEFLTNQSRFQMLNVVNKDKAEALLKANIESAKKRFSYYEKLDKGE